MSHTSHPEYFSLHTLGYTEPLPFFFSDPPWSSKLLPVFLWQEGKHCCPTDPLAHGFFSGCVQRSWKELLIPSSSSSLSWWKSHTGTWPSSAIRTTDLILVLCLLLAGDLPVQWCEVEICKSTFSNAQLGSLAAQSVGKPFLYVHYVEEWLAGVVALTPKCIFWGIWVVWLRQGTGGGGEEWFPSGERWAPLRRAGQSLLMLLSSHIILVHPLTTLSSVQAGHSFFVRLT